MSTRANTGNTATVIGGGVSGLSTAITLQEAGWDVTIWAAIPTHSTTSTIAAAIWHPYKAYPEEDVMRWGKVTYDILGELVNDSRTGIIIRDGMEIWPDPIADPPWRDLVARFERVDSEHLPAGYKDGFLFRVPVIEMPIYLTYLLERFEGNGGTIVHRQVTSLDEAAAVSTLVINCAGLAARELVNDQTMLPIRGQVIWVKNPGIERFWLDEANPDTPTYIIPRSKDCVLGGTAIERDWDTTPRPVTAEEILERCTRLEPSLRDAQIIAHRVGLRPGRPAIRLERETLPDGTVCIHNYGHGGSGVTLSWGCAREVSALAASV